MARGYYSNLHGIFAKLWISCSISLYWVLLGSYVNIYYFVLRPPYSIKFDIMAELNKTKVSKKIYFQQTFLFERGSFSLLILSFKNIFSTFFNGTFKAQIFCCFSLPLYPIFIVASDFKTHIHVTRNLHAIMP